MTKRKCLACGEYFRPWPQTPDQSYCSKQVCQKERRRRTKQKERVSNTAATTAQKGNLTAENRDSAKSHRQQQKKQRSKYRHQTAAAIHHLPLPPGLYILTRLDGDKTSRGNEWIAEIRILSAFPKDG